MAVYPKQKAGELIGILFLASSMLLILSLISYSGMDASASVSSGSRAYENLVGRIGAWTSDSLFQIFGLSALCLPLPLLFVGYRKIRGQTLAFPFIKLLAFSCALVALSAGFTLLSPLLPETVNFTAGGILGIITSDFLTRYLNTAGSAVVVLTTLIASLLLTTRFSIGHLLGQMSSLDATAVFRVFDRVSRWRDRRRDKKRVAALKKDKGTVVTQSAPRKVFLHEGAAPSEEPSEGTAQPHTPEVRLPAGEPAAPETKPAESTFIPSPALPIERPYQVPLLNFLQASVQDDHVNEEDLIERARTLAMKCAEFDVHGRVMQIHPGPVVTTFEFKPDPGVKYSKITNLEEDLCLALKAECVRVDRIPGKNTVGVEVPNLKRKTIYLRDLLEGVAFQQSHSPLTLALGKLINGNGYVSDLRRRPHLLIAGATGSGKSVALNCMVCSVLYKSSPADVRFIMIDPKRLELGVYEDIPHLLTPIVTDPKKAANALNWAVIEMEDRYKRLAQEGVRNIEQYNRVVNEHSPHPDSNELTPLPYVVIIVDELADLMMTAGKEVEASLTRLAQMARATGIHLILATQRPSVDVLTGLIKANFPCRISFRVSSKIDSRTILDCNGAEQLLGHGDMLFLPPGTARLIRIHGAFISEKEIRRITDFLKEQAEPEYREEVLEGSEEEKESAIADIGEMEDELYDEAARFVVETGKASTSLLQRRLRIGYGRAARLLDMMEHEGVVGPPDGSKPREVLVSADFFDQITDS